MFFRTHIRVGGKPDVDDASSDDHGDSMLRQLAAEHDDDARRLRRTVLVAAAVHVVLLFVTFPEILSRPIEVGSSSKKLYVVQQVRFRPPVARPQQTPPKKTAKKIPIPDPTPDDPEPIVVDEVTVPEIDLLEGLDVVFGIPEAPPGTGGLEGFGDALEVGAGVEAPIKIYYPEPRYTEEARRSRIQGVAILRTVIDENGDVVAAEAVKGLPLGLTESAIETVKTWKFEPATQDGVPVKVFYLISVNFRLI